MSTLLRNEAKQQEEAQAQINAANEIFKAVREWQSDPGTASRRWPWELLQNALDSVAGRKRQITVSFTLSEDRLIVEHDGGIFQTDELVALLLGGTSKIQKSRPYTGRFGSGFLVTHAIATRVQVEGRVQTKTGEESFRAALERGGDVETIRGGIENNFVELESSISEELPAARFTYEITRPQGSEVAKLGLQELAQLVPFVFAFSAQLASVRIHAQGELREFRKEDDYPLGKHQHISACKIADSKGAPVHVISIHPIEDDKSATIAFAAGLKDGTWMVDHIGPLVPKLFCQYPLIETAGIGLPFVLNGAFEPDERRLNVFIGAGTLESEKNERLIERMLGTVPSILTALGGTGWIAVHRLADVTSSNDHETRRGWWDTKLRRLADTLCKTPLIEGFPEGAFLRPADSAVPLSSFSTKEAPGLVDRDLVLYLLKTIEQNVPAAAVAAEWEDIARHWKLLGCDRPRCYGLAELLDHLRKGTSLQEFSKLHGFETSTAFR